MFNLYPKYILLLLLIVIYPSRMWSCDCSFFQSFCTYNSDIPIALISITCLEENDTLSVDVQYQFAVANEVLQGEMDIGDTVLVQSTNRSCDYILDAGIQLLVKGSSFQLDTVYNLNFFRPSLCIPDYLYIEGDSVRGNNQTVVSFNIYDILFQKMQFDEFINTFPELCSTSSNTSRQYPEMQFSIHPNPTTSKLFVEGISETKTKYKIYSISGKLVKKENLDFPEIEVASLKPGLYCIFMEETNSQRSKTFVKH